MNDLYYEVSMDYDAGREIIVVCDGDRAIDVCFTFTELFKKYPVIQSKEFKEFLEEEENERRT